MKSHTRTFTSLQRFAVSFCFALLAVGASTYFIQESNESKQQTQRENVADSNSSQNLNTTAITERTQAIQAAEASGQNTYSYSVNVLPHLQ